MNTKRDPKIRKGLFSFTFDEPIPEEIIEQIEILLPFFYLTHDIHAVNDLSRMIVTREMKPGDANNFVYMPELLKGSPVLNPAWVCAAEVIRGFVVK